MSVYKLHVQRCVYDERDNTHVTRTDTLIGVRGFTFATTGALIVTHTDDSIIAIAPGWWFEVVSEIQAPDEHSQVHATTPVVAGMH